MEVNALHRPDRTPDTTDELENTCPKLEDQVNTSTTYRFHTQVGVSLSEIFPHVITNDTTAGLSLIETVLTTKMSN